jgi:hypothetical protein
MSTNAEATDPTPLNANVPASTVVAPVNVFTPANPAEPLPTFFNATVPPEPALSSITPANTPDAFPAPNVKTDSLPAALLRTTGNTTPVNPVSAFTVGLCPFKSNTPAADAPPFITTFPRPTPDASAPPLKS